MAVYKKQPDNSENHTALIENPLQLAFARLDCLHCLLILLFLSKLHHCNITSYNFERIKIIFKSF